jgi:hypothetical protein
MDPELTVELQIIRKSSQNAVWIVTWQVFSRYFADAVVFMKIQQIFYC